MRVYRSKEQSHYSCYSDYDYGLSKHYELVAKEERGVGDDRGVRGKLVPFIGERHCLDRWLWTELGLLLNYCSLNY